MNPERCLAICVLGVMATIVFVANIFANNDMLLLVGSLFLIAELILLGIGDRGL